MAHKGIKPERILLINIFGIGDVLFTTPLISNLKYHFPKSFIGYIANRRTAGFLEGHPKIDKVFVYDRDEYQNFLKKSRLDFFKKFLSFQREIKREKFDCVIDLSLNSFMNFLTWSCGIRTRVGFNYKNRSPFLTTKVRLDGYEGRHVVTYYLGLLEELGLDVHTRELEFPLKEQDLNWADEFLKRWGVSPKVRLIGLVPGGGASWGKDAVYKRWPPEKYAKLADKIVEKFSADIILLGDEKEVELCREVSGLMHHPPFTACGKTTPGQFAALLKRCTVNIVNDGGPLHVAVAVGARSISIFGPVDERVYGPYPAGGHSVVSKNLSCRPCYRRFRMAECGHISCLREINVEDVFGKVEEIL